MEAVKQFRVFGEPIDIVVTGSATNGSFCMLVQTSPPGGGPPPHMHVNEDEIFCVLEGDFELFDGETWQKAVRGEHVYKLRGSVHTFRNCGASDGRILCIATPAGLDTYLEAIAPLQMPNDFARLKEISDAYGITFVTPEVPTEAPV